MAKNLIVIPREIRVLVTAAFLIALGYGLIAPIIPQFAQTFDVGMAAASAVVSVFALSRLVFAPVSGRLIDALGSRAMYLTGLVLVALTTAALSIAQEYWQILLLRGMAGVGSTMFTVSAMNLIVGLAPPQIRGRCSSAYASAFLMGGILGPLVGSVLAPLGMRIPFVIYGATLMVAVAVVWLRMPRGVDKPEGADERAPMSFREAYRDSAYRSALVSAFAHGWSNFGVRVATLPLFVAAIFQQSGAAAGFALTAFALGNAVCLQFSGRLADSVGRRPLIVTGLVVNGLFTGLMGVAETLPLLLAFSVGAGAGAGMLTPAQQAVVADVVGAQRSGGKVLANFQMAMDFGAILGPIVVGTVAQAWGFGWGFALCGVLSLTAALLWLRGRETLVS
ncbi:MFS transporter [Corynebacterium lowii]|uniref:Tetracycline resistance protein, class B n=1 Tax=Corynebacterium lowii TaxID=1544413 RepID=A0A0Q1AI80_9CORY|nr:MFS transporter [Corynebacterium lowii]KQB86328.1 Tetracycline resistance protein, class B [Corynebacterium lowii]MDP9850813.1 MFS family permease [Corynebacterium lowii]